MNAKDAFDELLRLLQIFTSWPVIFFYLVLLVHRKDPKIIPSLLARITEFGPGGVKFADLKKQVDNQQTQVETLTKKIRTPRNGHLRALECTNVRDSKRRREFPPKRIATIFVRIGIRAKRGHGDGFRRSEP